MASPRKNSYIGDYVNNFQFIRNHIRDEAPEIIGIFNLLLSTGDSILQTDNASLYLLQ